MTPVIKIALIRRDLAEDPKVLGADLVVFANEGGGFMHDAFRYGLAAEGVKGFRTFGIKGVGVGIEWGPEVTAESSGTGFPLGLLWNPGAPAPEGSRAHQGQLLGGYGVLEARLTTDGWTGTWSTIEAPQASTEAPELEAAAPEKRARRKA